MENFHDYGKLSGVWKNLLIVKSSFTLEKLFDLLSWKIICLIVLRVNANVGTIKTYILNLEQKLGLFTFFMEDKINIIFSRSLSTNSKSLMSDSNESLFTLNQI